KALKEYYANGGNYFRNPHLKAAFTFQNMYLGISPYDALATYSLIQYTELANGVWFPIGGLYRVIESLEAIARSKGVRFVYRTPVTRIDVEGDRATGVALPDGSRAAADVIVANADLPYAYRALLPDDGSADRLERLKYTSSAIMFFWGVDRLYPHMGTHNVLLCGDYRTSFDRIFRDKTLPDEPSFYVHAPTRVDPAAAPAGQDSLMVLVPVGHIDAGARQDLDALRYKARAAVLARLAKEGMGDLEKHLKFEASYTPEDWKSEFNLAKGAAFGLSHNFTQVGYLRPQNRHSKYRNLYFAGGSTHPGTGLPLVLISARLTTERILHEVGAPQRAFQPIASPAGAA
ncbi:MAG: phytoene desaturase family protein, partial [Chloroflexi bacterium]|nr:phytoene desaturase family protein [Chloroflexota bacterium]